MLYINMTTGMYPPGLKLGDTGTLYINMTTGMYPPCLKVGDTKMLYINMTTGMYPPASSWETPGCSTST